MYVVREDFVRDIDAPYLCKIRIRGIVGDSVEADLIKLNIIIIIEIVQKYTYKDIERETETDREREKKQSA